MHRRGFIDGYEAITAAISANLTINGNPQALRRDLLINWLHQNQVETILGTKSSDTNGQINEPRFGIYIIDNNNNYLQLP